MLKGIGCSGGYGIGNVLMVIGQEFDCTSFPAIGLSKEHELERYHLAVEKFCAKMEKTVDRLRRTVGDKESEIIAGHVLMIKDPYMSAEIEKLIENGQCAENAVVSVCDMFAQAFAMSDDELTKLRCADVNDIKDTLLAILLGREQPELSEVPANTVIVARELTPSMTAGLDKSNVVGIITEMGGKTSHSSILAKALNIPAVSGVSDVLSNLENGEEVIVDGNNGIIIEKPSIHQLEEYQYKRENYMHEKKDLAEFIYKSSVSADGIEFEVCGNIGTPDEANTVMEYGGDGIGLFRTEFLFMNSHSIPDENVQFEAYKKAALIMKGKPVVIRTLDIGGDKNIPYLDFPKEENPFLGIRAIRICLKNRELFRTQLKALMRASAFGNIWIMIPFVTRIDELREVRKMIKEIMQEFDVKSIPYKENIKLGVMIETAAAAIIADILAREADFFSIGTNDLVQYTMSADRNNADTDYLYSVFDPAVLRLVKYVIECAKKANIPVEMCGEAASDSLMMPMLISFGLNRFSVDAASIPSTRKALVKWTKSASDALAERIMLLETEKEVVELLKES